MAIILNDNLQINAGKPIDSRYLATGNTVYTSTGATNSAIPVPLRYTGLTVNIQGTEYWYKNGVANSNLIQKKYDTVLPIGSYVTGATNIGYFSGMTGIQTLPITYLLNAAYDGNYNSLYNYYYRGTDQKIHVGTPLDGILKRGYYKSTVSIASWIWDDYTSGWILVAGNVANQIGTIQSAITYYPPSVAYTNTSWTTGSAYSNGSDIAISTVTGSLTTGTTLSVGGPVYATKVNNILEFRTIETLTPNLIKVSNNEAFVYLSGSTGNQVISAANGLTVVGQTVKLGGTLTGTTTITEGVGNTAGIEYGGDYSATYTDRSLVDRGYVNSRASSSGERIYKTICQPSHGFSSNCVVGWSGGTYNLAIANGTYDGEVIGIVTKCFNNNCFEITQAGFVSSGLTGLVTNTTYFLSDTYYGCLTCIEPTTVNNLSKAVLIATSTCTGWVLPYAAYTISSGITEGGPLIKNVCLAISPYSMTSNDYFVGVAGGSVVVLPSAPKPGMEVVVADTSGTALASPITIFGTIIGPQSSASINTDFGSLTLIWNGTTWSVIGFAPTSY